MYSYICFSNPSLDSETVFHLKKKTQRHTMQKNSTKIREIDSRQLQESDPVSDQDTWRLCCHLDSKEHVWSNFEAETTSHQLYNMSFIDMFFFLNIAVSSAFCNGQRISKNNMCRFHPLGSPYRCRVARSLHCNWPPEAGCRNLQGLR